MEKDINFLKNGRRPQFFFMKGRQPRKIQITSFFQMKDNLKKELCNIQRIKLKQWLWPSTCNLVQEGNVGAPLIGLLCTVKNMLNLSVLIILIMLQISSMSPSQCRSCPSGLLLTVEDSPVHGEGETESLVLHCCLSEKERFAHVQDNTV